jgi:HAD superfamily hydrolase (TIGR01549 family)
MQTKLIIFDVDGVIFDTFSIATEIYDKIAEEFNIKKPTSQDFYKDFFELDWRLTLKKWNITSKKDMKKVIEIFNSFTKNNEHIIKPFKNIDFVLKKLKNHYELAIVSNNKKSNFIPRLQKFNLKQYFSLVLGIDDGEFKPSPDLLIKCMKRLNYYPKETIFVGDMDGDILAGKRAKLKKTIAVTYGFHNQSKLNKADVIINSPLEIIGAVK